MSGPTHALFNQQGSQVTAFSVASGGVPAPTAGLDAILYSHTGTPYALQPLLYDPAGETGFQGTPTTLMGTSPSTPGSTSVEIGADGEVGVVIDSDNLLDGGAVPSGPMPLVLQWIAPSPVVVFPDAGVASIMASVDLQVPYSAAGGLGSTISSNQIVLYMGLVDQTTGRQIAFGQTLYDSRGTSNPYFGVDSGAGGTGATVCTRPAGYSDRFTTPVDGAATFQGQTWTGFKQFAFQITPANLMALVTSTNNNNPGNTPLSTNLADYVLTNVSLDAETEYFGTYNSFAYLAQGLSLVQEGSTVTTLAPLVTSEDSALGNAAQAITVLPTTTPTAVPPAQDLAPTTYVTATDMDSTQTIQAATGQHYVVTAGQGNLVFVGADHSSTVYAASGDVTLSGGGGSMVAYGGTGTLVASGGAQGYDTLSAGGGNATLFGSHDDLLSAGLGMTTIYAGAGNNTVYGGGATASSTMVVGGSGNDLVIAGPGHMQIFAGTGSDTVWGSAAGGSAAIIGGAGQAQLVGGAGMDAIWAGSGQTTIVGGSGSEIMVGGATSVSIFAGSGQNSVFGGTGGSFVDTGSGTTMVSLSPGAGAADMVSMGSGNSTVFSGASPDSYLYTAGQSAGTSVLADFRVGIDHLVLQGSTAASAIAGAQDTPAGLVLDIGGAHATLLGIHVPSTGLFA